MKSARIDLDMVIFRRAIATGVAYFLIATATLHLVNQSDNIAIIWPASGLLLATLLMRGENAAYPYIATAALGSFAANFIDSGQVGRSAVYTLANMIEPLAIAWILKVKLQYGLSFSRPRHLTWFSIAAVIGCMLSATIVSAIMSANSFAFWFSWFSTDVLGVLIVTPLILIGRRAIRSRYPGISKLKTAEAVAIFVVLTAVSWATFYQPGGPLLFLPMFLVLFAASRLGPIGAAAGVLIVTIIGNLSFDDWTLSAMLFGSSAPAKSIFFQFYLLTLFAAALPIAALLAERDRALAKLGEEKRLIELAENNADLGHWWLDVDSRKVRWSRGVFTIFGIAAENPPSLDTAIAAYHPDDRSIVTNHMAKAIDEGTGFEFRARIVRPTGEVRHVRSRGEIDYYHDRITLFGIVQDVSAQVHHELAITDARNQAQQAARLAQVIADTDQLTEIPNRRRVLADLAEAVAEARCESTALSIALFDIDHFKRVNDTFGHHSGDEVLRRVAKIAANEIRRSDLIGRLGGEEFIVLLPNTNAAMAMTVAELVRMAVESSDMNPCVTISVGVAELARHEDGDGVLQRADQALYLAKREGRNTLRLAA